MNLFRAERSFCMMQYENHKYLSCARYYQLGFEGPEHVKNANAIYKLVCTILWTLGVSRAGDKTASGGLGKHIIPGPAHVCSISNQILVTDIDDP